jgi:hypothetical protein
VHYAQAGPAARRQLGGQHAVCAPVSGPYGRTCSCRREEQQRGWRFQKAWWLPGREAAAVEALLPRCHVGGLLLLMARAGLLRPDRHCAWLWPVAVRVALRSMKQSAQDM